VVERCGFCKEEGIVEYLTLYYCKSCFIDMWYDDVIMTLNLMEW
jgi:hypothetical protein